MLVAVVSLPFAAGAAERDRVNFMCRTLDRFVVTSLQPNAAAETPVIALDQAGTLAGAAAVTSDPDLKALGNVLLEVINYPPGPPGESVHLREHVLDYYKLFVGSAHVMGDACADAGIKVSEPPPVSGAQLQSSGDIREQLSSLVCGGAHLWLLPSARFEGEPGPLTPRGDVRDDCSGLRVVGRLKFRPTEPLDARLVARAPARVIPPWILVSIANAESLVPFPGQTTDVPAELWVDLRLSCLLHQDPFRSDLCRYFVFGRFAPPQVIRAVEKALKSVETVDVEGLSTEGLPNLTLTTTSSDLPTLDCEGADALSLLSQGVAVRNTGESVSPSVFAVSIGRKRTRVELLRGLEPHESVEVASGPLSEKVKIDPNNRIKESDETDNTLAKEPGGSSTITCVVQ